MKLQQEQVLEDNDIPKDLESWGWTVINAATNDYFKSQLIKIICFN